MCQKLYRINKVPKFLWTNKNLGCINFLLKRLCWFLVFHWKQSLGQNSFSIQEKTLFMVQKYKDSPKFWSWKCWLKIIFSPKKKGWFKTNVGQKKYLSKKRLFLIIVSPKSWYEKRFVHNKIWSKIFLVQNISGRKQLVQEFWVYIFFGKIAGTKFAKTYAAWTNAAWKNFTGTVVPHKRWSQKHTFKVLPKTNE